MCFWNVIRKNINISSKIFSKSAFNWTCGLKIKDRRFEHVWNQKKDLRYPMLKIVVEVGSSWWLVFEFFEMSRLENEDTCKNSRDISKRNCYKIILIYDHGWVYPTNKNFAISYLHFLLFNSLRQRMELSIALFHSSASSFVEQPHVKMRSGVCKLKV